VSNEVFGVEARTLESAFLEERRRRLDYFEHGHDKRPASLFASPR
jgi:hypothetical protein